MRWKQFLTPVKSMDAVEARDTLAREGGSFTLLDVRQPEEYEAEHLPGAKLIPLPELSSTPGRARPGAADHRLLRHRRAQPHRGADARRQGLGARCSTSPAASRHGKVKRRSAPRMSACTSSPAWSRPNRRW